MELSNLLKRAFVPVLGAAIVGACTWSWVKTTGVAHAKGGEVASTAPPAVSRVGIRVDGRVVAYPGADVTVGTDVMGRLKVVVGERARVNKGELVAEIDADEQMAALAEARATVAQIDAELRYLDSDYARVGELTRSGSLPKENAERALRDRDVARARQATAWASVRRLEAALAKTRILAPIDGVVMERLAEPGETVAPGARILRIADLARMRIEAEVDEFDVSRVARGDEVVVTAEGYSGRSWRGSIEETPDEVVSRRLKPVDPAHPTDTRVLLAKIVLAPPGDALASPLKLGQRVEVTIRPSRP
jgi:HlyD family secretion protein